ncbi:hypothetical protein R1sor_021260 [Riccia sorocarpa]|uniref:Uncharacterized protein n=1 Tax=Riccia sorocarpa TaxID=122646 RepID=A0ABD3GM95_9MARC
MGVRTSGNATARFSSVRSSESLSESLESESVSSTLSLLARLDFFHKRPNGGCLSARRLMVATRQDYVPAGMGVSIASFEPYLTNLLCYSGMTPLAIPAFVAAVSKESKVERAIWEPV